MTIISIRNCGRASLNIVNMIGQVIFWSFVFRKSKIKCTPEMTINIKHISKWFESNTVILWWIEMTFLAAVFFLRFFEIGHFKLQVVIVGHFGDLCIINAFHLAEFLPFLLWNSVDGCLSKSKSGVCIHRMLAENTSAYFILWNAKRKHASKQIDWSFSAYSHLNLY